MTDKEGSSKGKVRQEQVLIRSTSTAANQRRKTIVPYSEGMDLHKIKNKGQQTRGQIILKLIFLLIVIGLSVVGILRLKEELLKDETMPITKVKIDGALTMLTKAELAQVVGAMAGNSNINSFDLNRLHNALLQIPWVAKVDLHKHLPNTIEVSVVEHIASALWNDNGLYNAKEQKVFYPDLKNFKQHLVRLRGVHDEQATLIYNYATRFIAALESARLQLVEVSLDSIGSWSLRLDNGVVLILGRDNDNSVVLKRLQRFVKTYRQLQLDLKSIKYIDLRYDVGFAVGNKQD